MKKKKCPGCFRKSGLINLKDYCKKCFQHKIKKGKIGIIVGKVKIVES